MDRTIERTLRQTLPMDQRQRKRRRGKRTGIDGNTAQTVLVVFLALNLLLCLMPVLVTLLLSVKSNAELDVGSIWTFPKVWQFSNYSSAIVSVLPNMFNTVVIDLISTFCMTMLSTFVAFLFSRKQFPGKNILFFCIIAPMLVPGVVSLTPSYLNMGSLIGTGINIRGTWWSLILPYIAGNQIASIFLYRVFMGQQPAELYEAAEIDGAGNFKMYFSICLPLSVAIMMVQSVSIFSAIYNDYLWPTLMFDVFNRGKATLMPVLQSLAQEQTQTGAQYALYLLSGIPLIITTLISLKFFINGEFAAGLKL